MKREDVYKLIDGEREYQNDIWDADIDSKTVGSHLTLLDTYLRAAKDGYTYTDGNRKALDTIRKIAALAVRCMELHDTPARSK
jgi:hypothetical protein